MMLGDIVGQLLGCGCRSLVLVVTQVQKQQKQNHSGMMYARDW